MLCRLVLGCCKKGGRLRSYFLLPNQISGKGNQEVGMVWEGSVSDHRGQRVAVCQKEQEALPGLGKGLVVSVVLSLIPWMVILPLASR